MPIGTLYANFRNRTILARALVNHFKIDVDIKIPEENKDIFIKQFPLKKVPAYYDSDGFELTEAMAINYFLLRHIPDKKLQDQLLGTDHDLKNKCQIIRWVSLANSDLCLSLFQAFAQLRGDIPYSKESFALAMQNLEKIINLYEERLKNHKYLVNDKQTLADLNSATIMSKGFDYIFGSEWRKQHPNTYRWFAETISSPILKDEFFNYEYLEKPWDAPTGEWKPINWGLD
ncbi:hypothetical protein TBLA_0B08390 [Henningerozyma blattae CBS 6284]|uniref:GST C-terminal domain-containing protein n=1 Tax=Henningerozyma blattae (strain ATCC 34711 / CBS 6284 / DSM 70876 / NBRC 10599 / NRRL Y-10934 / UCD 77-7) TaxID=1071380 RepID=I2GZV2_HENB6|nr:hypothetical protein TBLA_0B08390 [Tetrapisispora blattae CBS 6284]CCH59654.1 hypothetical protein TBLA_0B08390 [Tetrapisispora blattae CBS 6284]